jgi:hypothetical protein
VHRMGQSSAREQSSIRDQVARRAYELYLERGGSDGFDVDDWLTAEQELALTMYVVGDARPSYEEDEVPPAELNAQLALDDQPESKIGTEVEKGS